MYYNSAPRSLLATLTSALPQSSVFVKRLIALIHNLNLSPEGAVEGNGTSTPALLFEIRMDRGAW